MERFIQEPIPSDPAVAAAVNAPFVDTRGAPVDVARAIDAPFIQLKENFYNPRPAQPATGQPAFPISDSGWYVTQSGNVVQLSPSSAYWLKARPATEEERDTELYQRSRGEGLHVPLTFLEQAIDTASLGGYGLASAAISPEYARDMELRSQRNRVASIGGTATGFVAPIAASFFTGGTTGAAALARGATMPMRALGAVGSAGVRAAESFGVKGAVAQTAVRWGTEGAALAAVHDAKTQMMSDAPFDAGHFAAAVGQGALFGAAMGAGGHAAFNAGKGLVGKATGWVSDKASGGFRSLAEGVSKFEQPTGPIDYRNMVVDHLTNSGLGASAQRASEVLPASYANNPIRMRLAVEDAITGELERGGSSMDRFLSNVEKPAAGAELWKATASSKAELESRLSSLAEQYEKTGLDKSRISSILEKTVGEKQFVSEGGLEPTIVRELKKLTEEIRTSPSSRAEIEPIQDTLFDVLKNHRLSTVGPERGTFHAVDNILASQEKIQALRQVREALYAVAPPVERITVQGGKLSEGTFMDRVGNLAKNAITNKAERYAYNSTGATDKTVYEVLEKLRPKNVTPEALAEMQAKRLDPHKIAVDYLNEGLFKETGGAFVRSREESLRAVQDKLSQVEEGVAGKLRTLDERALSMGKVAVDNAEIVSDFQNVLRHMERASRESVPGQSLRGAVDDFLNAYGGPEGSISLQDLKRFERKMIAPHAEWDKNVSPPDLKPKAEVFRDFQQRIEARISTKVDQLGKEFGMPEVGLEYRQAKAAFRAHDGVRRALEQGVRREFSTQGRSGLFGTIAATAFGGSILGLPGALVSGAIASKLSVGMSKYSDALLGNVAHRIGQGQTIKEIALEGMARIRTNTAKAMDSVFGGKSAELSSVSEPYTNFAIEAGRKGLLGAKAALAAGGRMGEAAAQRTRVEIQRQEEAFFETLSGLQAIADGGVAGGAGQVGAMLSREDRNTANAITNQTVKVAQVLSAEAPKVPKVPGVDGFVYMAPGAVERNEFFQNVALVYDPAHMAPAALAAGTLTPKHVELLSRTHPSVLAEMRSVVRSKLSEKQDKLEYSVIRKTSVLFDKPVDATFSGTYLSTIEMIGQPPAGQASRTSQTVSLSGAQKQLADSFSLSSRKVQLR